MSTSITIPRPLFILLVAAPLLLGARVATTHQAQGFVPPIFSPGNRIRDDKQREFDVIQVDGDWAQIRLRSNAGLASLGGGDAWLYIPTNNMYTLQ